MKNLHFIAGLAAAIGRVPAAAPDAQELDKFAAKCRRVHITELGHLMFTAPTKTHEQVAQRVMTERLAAKDLQAHEEEQP